MYELTNHGAKAVLEAAAVEFGVTPDKILGRSRKSDVMLARRAAAFVMRRMGASYEQIAMATGRSCHTTSIYACKVALAEMVDPRWRDRVLSIERSMRGDPEKSAVVFTLRVPSAALVSSDVKLERSHDGVRDEHVFRLVRVPS